MNHRLRYLHDLLHVLDGDGVLLALHIETDQLQFIAGVLFLALHLGLRRAGYGSVFCDRRDLRELPLNELGEVQNHDHRVTARVLDETGKHFGIYRGANGPNIFDVAGIDAHYARNPVHHEAQRLTDVYHQGACRIVVL